MGIFLILCAWLIQGLPLWYSIISTCIGLFINMLFMASVYSIFKHDKEYENNMFEGENND